MKTKISVAATFAFGLAIFTACNRDLSNDQFGIPDGAIMITNECYNGHNAKTSVYENSVTWVSGDIVKLNNVTKTVNISGSNRAYVSDFTVPETPFYGYYPHDIVVGMPNSDNTTVTVPSDYTCYYNGERQVIKLPMIAKTNGNATTIQFKHVTAAIQVQIKNITGHILTLDSVVVSSNTLQLSGTRAVTIGKGSLWVNDQETTDTPAANKRVAVTFEDNTYIGKYSNESDITYVQIPILPVGSGSMTIVVYTHIAGTPKGANTYIFSHTASSDALARNVMMKARIEIGGIHTTSNQKGLFSVSNSKQVCFSKGNLQCSTNNGWSTYTWSFAGHQYDVVETQNVSVNYSNQTVIGLFGWGTSGNNNATYHFPYNTQTTQSNYGPSISNAVFDYNSFDWGYNCISNGGDDNGQWRTLTKDEWIYLLKTRTNASQKRGAGYVGGKSGLIIIPDSFTDPKTNGGNKAFNSTPTNIYTEANWDAMEAAGAIFIPKAGDRNGQKVEDVDNTGWYWSSTALDHSTAWCLTFNSNNPSEYYMPRNYGLSVRLVQDMN